MPAPRAHPPLGDLFFALAFTSTSACGMPARPAGRDIRHTLYGR